MELTPIWTPMPNRPWQVYNYDTQDVLRYPPKDNAHRAITFHTAEDAWKYINKGGRKMSRILHETHRICGACGTTYSPNLTHRGTMPRGYKVCPKCSSTNTEFVEWLNKRAEEAK